MIKILRESMYNRIMFAGFILIMLCNLVSLLLLYEHITTIMGTVLTIMSIPISLLLAFYPQLKKNNNKNNYEIAPKSLHFVGLINCSEIKKKQSMLLKRTQHRNNIIKKIEDLFSVRCNAKGLILTGESGAGKSILLQFLAYDLKVKGYNVHFNCTYNSSKGFPEQFNKRKKNIFIFDQFEKSLKFDSMERWIDEHNDDLKNCVFVFSFPQKFLTGIYNKIYRKNSDFYLQSYVLYLNEEDEEDYLKKITDISGLDEILVRNMWHEKEFMENHMCIDERTTAMTCLLERELYNVKKGNSPLIEMEFLGEMVERYAGSDTVITDGNFIDYYFDRWVDEFDRKETAYAILTLFTRYEQYCLTDIKLITFEDSIKFDKEKDGKILSILLHSSFLNNYIGSIDRKKQSDYLFAPQHEFVSRSIQKYLASKEVPSGIKCYVEYYRTNSKFQNYGDKVKKNYDIYIKKHSAFNLLLCIMLIVLLGFNLYELFLETESPDYILHKIFITGVSFPSMYYIFNYCDKIMYAKGRTGAFISGLVGISAITLSYLFPNLWGVFFGGEVIAFSICIYASMTRGLVNEARTNLLKDFRSFLLIGITISALGVIYLLFFGSIKETSWQSNILKYSYYFLFFIYSLLSNFNHIKYSYICSKIGYLNMFVV